LGLYFAIPCLCLALSSNNARADATPFKNNLRLRILVKYDLKPAKSLDSTFFLFSSRPESFDTYPRWNRPYGQPGPLRYGRYENPISSGEDTFEFHRPFTDPRPFKIIFFFSDRKLESPVLDPVHSNSEFELSITNNQVIDSTTFFQVPWSTYFALLFATILIELFVGIRGGIPLPKAHSIITANLISHPLLWTICTYGIGFEWGLFLGEIGVVAFEAWWIWLFCKQFLTPKQCINLSLLMNLLSFVLGGVLSFFLN